jgi:endonuclease YncB( thermonuclease family)
MSNLNVDDSWLNQNYDLKNVPSFIPPIAKAKVLKVYDGDTFTIVTKLYKTDQVYQFQVRLNGLDTAELKGTKDKVKKMSIIARDKLSELIFNKVVSFKNISYDKYGRLLADVFINDINVDKWMLDNNLALSYDGGHKDDPNVWNEIFDKYWNNYYDENYEL